MVCDRCIIVTETILNKLGVQNYEVSLGQINFKDQVSNEVQTNLREELEKVGFEIVEDKHQQVIESIKATIIKYLELLNEGTTIKMSQYISDNVYCEYSYLSDLFSKAENKTIEKYFIELRIDKAKELLKYSKDDIRTIGQLLGFSSSQHFSNQFKQYLGITPNTFRKIHKNQ